VEHLRPISLGIMTIKEIPIKAIDHLEFTCNTLGGETEKLFRQFGFGKSFSDDNSSLFSQGQVRFLLTANQDQSAHSRQYFEKHGEGVSKISFQVDHIEEVLGEVLKRGADLVDDLKMEESEAGVFKTASIKGFGDVLNEFVERPSSQFRPGFHKLDNDPEARPLSVRASRIDHLTNNVPKGEMDHWVDFYQRIYGFKVSRYFDIKGVKTGLESKVVQSENGQVIIPINEPESEDGKSQIQEFLDLHKGPGVQHVALMTPKIMSTVADLRERGIRFLDIPHTYYEDIPKRLNNVEESLEELEKLQLLVDGDDEGYLLQNFTQTYIGPLFFEIIERKNHWGFGEGNFQALFDSIERDQMQRGYLK